MAYIGNSPANTGNYQIVDDISSSFNGSLTSFALTSGSIAITPAKSGQILANINGVMQEPDDGGTNGFKVTSSNIIFSSAPASGDTFWAVYQGQNVDIGTPSDDVVDTAHIKDDAVTAAKLANSINTEIAANTAKTGITTAQASAITANTAKVTNSTDASDLTSGTLPSARLGTITGFTSTGIDDNADATAITIDSSENVGIGITPDDARLQVSGNVFVGNAASNATIDNNLTGGGLDVAVGSGTKAFQVWDDSSTATPRFIVERGGNVGIGTASPASPLHVAGNMQVNTTTNDSNELRFKVTPGGAGDNCTVGLYQDDGTTAGVYMQADGASWFTGGINPSSGNTTASNVLNDYEEGTCTLTLDGASNYSGASATYVKVGNMCTVAWYTGSFTSTAVLAIIRGFPFTSANNGSTYTGGSTGHNSWTPNCANIVLGNNATVAYCADVGVAGWSTAVAGTKYFMMGITYRTT